MQQITKFQIKDVDASTVSGNMSLNTLVITSTTDASSTTTGSLQTRGGLGVAKTLRAATVVATGTVSGSTISGSTISGTSISGSTISGTSISGSTISGSTSITGGTITGTTITGTSSIVGGAISGTTITGSNTVTGLTLRSTSGTAATSPTTGSIRSGGGIGAAGAIYAGGDVTAFSDERLKTNIEKIDNALDKACALNGYVYDRTDMDLRQTGLIAQEVLVVLPEAVRGSEEQMYGINYGSLMGLMVEAIKELRTEVNDLKKALSGE